MLPGMVIKEVVVMKIDDQTPFSGGVGGDGGGDGGGGDVDEKR